MRTLGGLATIVAVLSACGPNMMPSPPDAQGGDGSQTGDAIVPADSSIADAPGDAAVAPDSSGPTRTFPQVTSGDGGSLASVTLVSVVASNDTQATEVLGFGDAVQHSQWWTTVTAEYGVGSIVHHYRVIGPPITADISDNDMLTYVQNAVTAMAVTDGGTSGVDAATGSDSEAGGSDAAPMEAGGVDASVQVPPPDASFIYLLYLPDGINEISSNTNAVNTNCQYQGGYHTPLCSPNQPGGCTTPGSFAYVQRCPTAPGQASLDELTTAASHEIAEAATDPDGRTGWVLRATTRGMPWLSSAWNVFQGPGGAELGDLCTGTEIVEGSYTYQRIWSNAAAARGGDPCIPAISSPYYTVSPAQSWTTVQAGTTTSIPVYGWSTRSTPEWLASPFVVYTRQGTAFTATMSGAPSQNLMGYQLERVNNGTAMQLNVHAPAAASGTWAVIQILSQSAATPWLYNAWPVGVYIQ